MTTATAAPAKAGRKVPIFDGKMRCQRASVRQIGAVPNSKDFETLVVYY